jgi:hypothetical protein
LETSLEKWWGTAMLRPCGGLSGNSFAALAMSDEHVDAVSDGAEEELE